MECGVRPNQLSVFQMNDSDAIHELEANRGDNEKVSRRNGIVMVIDEGLPSLTSRSDAAVQYSQPQDGPAT